MSVDSFRYYRYYLFTDVLVEDPLLKKGMLYELKLHHFVMMGNEWGKLEMLMRHTFSSFT